MTFPILTSQFEELKKPQSKLVRENWEVATNLVVCDEKFPGEPGALEEPSQADGQEESVELVHPEMQVEQFFQSSFSECADTEQLLNGTFSEQDFFG